ncbi:S8 family serine peptidase [Nocardiopsis changdeensis]|uniref:S8 family serine peptidase n=1 Tax=Nocardiopsis changdeensis TaxID=2831969 RepID=A0ABX8BJ07_9ACTN|nr:MULTISPECIES: S8 family serine peptidase [Nocardiopsis]QUX20803.1 S8 family serine peptidase [Nocardiopsis changdeensis]QYX36735.1 S8 family serine peptidase [Nocardiopsis sp. MT53]
MRSTPAPGAAVGRAAAALLLALVPLAAPAAAAADTAGDEPPPPLPQVFEFKGERQPCSVMGTEVVEQEPWTRAFLGLDRAHRLSTGSGTEIAVLAPELDAAGPALEGAVEGGGSQDCLGHGTFLAGVAGGRAVEDSGTLGVAPGVSLRFIPAGDPNTGVTPPGQIASGITEATAAGSDVILVGTAAWENSTALDDAVAAATEAGSLVVAPATVNTVRGPMAGHPSQHPDALSVAAHDPEGLPVVAAPVLRADGELVRVDLLAPGDLTVGPGPGGGHVIGSGPGVAAAFAAGTASLLAAREPELTPGELRQRLISTAYSSPSGSGDPVGGGGRVDPVAALTTVPAGESALSAGGRFVPDPSPLGSLDALPTWAVVGGAGLLIVMCVLAAAVVRNGRARDWRPATPGEPVP